MHSFVQQALLSFCSNHQIFGRSSAFVCFNEDSVHNEDGLASLTFFGRINYLTSSGAHRFSPPIMLKVLPSHSRLRSSTLEEFFNELFFYTRVMPIFQQLGDLQSLIPQFYDSHIQISAGANNFLLIFEDLRNRGFRTHPLHSFLDIEHLLLMVHQLGHFHAFSYRLKATNPHEFHSLGRLFYSHVDEMRDVIWLQRTAQRGLQRLRMDSRYAHRLALLEEVAANASEYMERLNTRQQDQPLSVLCHGDFLRGNVMFRYEDGLPVEMKMIDMASCRVASPVLDLTAMLYLNASQRTRDEHWDTLINTYYAGLQAFGSEGVPSRSAIVDAFRGRAMYGYIIASFFLGHTMAFDIGMPTLFDLLPEEHVGKNFPDLPREVKSRAEQLVGGEECTEALADILRDIIDRDFVC